MNKPIELPSIVNVPFAGGYYCGRIMLPNGPHAVIVAPKAAGELKPAILTKSSKRIEGALSYFDGLANTKALAEAGSKIAEQVLALNIDGHTDWHIPARDALELLYRHCKPGQRNNYTYRSGENPSSIPVGYPYTQQLPAQAADPLFREGGDEAFEDDWYWSSTQSEPDGACAWCQTFGYGSQHYAYRSGKYRVRAVRAIPI